MAAITATDVTVTVSGRDKDIGHGRLGKNVTIASVAFGDGSLTYPTGGVPLPVIGMFGFQRVIDFCSIQEPVANGFQYKYDSTNHKILIFTQGVLTGATGASLPGGNAGKVKNSAGAETSMQLPGAAVNTTHDLGASIQLPNTVAPAAATLKLLLFGE